MLDLMSRLSDTLGSIMGSSSAGNILQGGDIGEALASAGLDPSVLHGLDAQQIVDLLASHGIDVASFAPEQIQGLIDQVSGDAGAQLTGFLEQFNPFDRN